MKKFKNFLIELGFTTKKEVANFILTVSFLAFNTFMLMELMKFVIHPFYFIGINFLICIISLLINKKK